MNTTAMRFIKHNPPTATDHAMSNPTEVLGNIAALKAEALTFGNTEMVRYWARMMTVLIANWHRQNA